MVSIIRTTGANKNFRQLVQLLDTDLNARYGTLQVSYEKYNVSDSIETVAVAFNDEVPAGCGGFKPFNPTTVEIKRMYVKSECRGQGIALQILTELETWARESGYSSAILETGIKQGEAIRLYTKAGYNQIENYGQYQGNSNSMCFRKELINKQSD
jgi:putative acetyltransferase